MIKAIVEFFVGPLFERDNRKKEKQFINPYEAVLALINMNAQLELSYLKEFLEIQKEKEKLLREVIGSEQRQKKKDEIVIDVIVINEIVIDKTVDETENIKKKLLNAHRR